MDDLWRSRIILDAATAPGRGMVPAGTPAFVGRVTSTGSALAVGKFCKVAPIAVTGSEADGATATLSPGTATVYAYPVGPGAPANGDYVVVRRVEHRWVFDKQSGGAGSGQFGTIPLCFCTQVPTTLTMTSADPTCNYRMFQSCTIQWQDTPAAFARFNLASKIFLSTETFADPVAGGAKFYYYLTCLYNQFSLTRLYPASPYGSPYRDGILYTWLLGGYGNTCEPFHLDGGIAFPGSDTSCWVTIDGA